MEKNELKTILENVSRGKLSPDDAILKIKTETFEDLGYAKPDFNRGIRQGASEIIYGEGKTAEQITGIVKSFLEHGQENILITRLSKEKAAAVQKETELTYHEIGRIGIVGKAPEKRKGKIVMQQAAQAICPLRRKRLSRRNFWEIMLYGFMMWVLPVFTDFYHTQRIL